MYEVMNIVLRLSLSGTLLTGILFLFRPLYKERLSRRWQSAMAVLHLACCDCAAAGSLDT